MGESRLQRKERKLREEEARKEQEKMIAEQYRVESIVQSRLSCIGWNNQEEINKAVNERLMNIGVLEREKAYGISFTLEVNRQVEKRLRELEDERKEKEREEKERKKKIEEEKEEREKVDTVYDRELIKISVLRMFFYSFVLFASFALNPKNGDVVAGVYGFSACFFILLVYLGIVGGDALRFFGRPVVEVRVSPDLIIVLGLCIAIVALSALSSYREM